MSKLNTITTNTTASVEQINHWLSGFDGSKETAFPGVYDLGQSMLVHVEPPDDDDDDVETMIPILGFTWTRKLFINSSPTTTEQTFRRLCELTVGFMKEFDGDFWLRGDTDGPIFCRLGDRVGVDEKLLTKRNADDFSAYASKSWDHFSSEVNRFGAC